MDNIHANPVGIIKKDIYVIKNDINQKLYIGQSLNAEERFKSHCKKNYDNSLVDAAIQKYGKEYFRVEILEKQIENYNEKEKYWIKEMNSLAPNGYNILEGGNEPPILYGDNHPNVKISDEQLVLLKQDLKETNIPLSQLAEKYSISKKQVLRINQGVSRSQIDEQYPLRESPNINGKLTEEDVDTIIELLKHTYRFNGTIAREFGVEVHAISQINKGEYHHRENVKYPIREWKSCGVIKLTYEQVTEIIKRLQTTKDSLNSIAKDYNVTSGTVKGINCGTYKTYKRDNLQYPIRPF